MQEITTGVEQHRLFNNITISSMIILIFDWLLMFEMEVSYIWQAPWNMMKVLYILSRYMPFIDITVAVLYVSGDILPVEICKILHQYVSVTYCVGLWIANASFMLWTWVVWGKKKSLGIGLAVFYVMSLLTFMVPFGFYLQSVTFFVALEVPQIMGCILGSPNMLFSVSFIGAIVFDLTMLLLMTIRAIQFHRSGSGLGLIKIIFRDGIIYYLYALVSSTLSLYLLLQPLDQSSIPLTLGRVLHSIWSCRVVLDIRRKAQQVVRGGAL